MNPTKFPQNPTAPWRVMVPKRWSSTGKRRAHYFKTQEAAQKFCQHVKRHGVGYATGEEPKGTRPVLNQRDLDHWHSAVQVCAAKLGDISMLYEAVEHYLATRLNIKQATLEEAIAAFHEARQKDPDVKSERTRQDDRSRLKSLARHFEGDPISIITEAKLHEYFSSLRGNHRSIYKTVKVFFGWARARNYLTIDPMDNIKPVGEFGINNEYYSIDKFGQMLRIAGGLEMVPGTGKTLAYCNLLPWMILSGFAGLRTCEASRVDSSRDAVRWTDLHWDASIPSIEIRKPVAKGGRRRFVDKSYAIDAARDWLDLYRKVAPLTEFVCPLGNEALGHLKSAFTRATGIKFSENGLRNSFATYALAYDGNEGAGSIAKQMGNSEKVLLSNYAQLLPSGSGKDWFNLRPGIAFLPTESIEEAA